MGVDPSINSTGIYVQAYDNNKKIYERFYIIRGIKLTKKESKASEEYKNIFEYILYDYHNPNSLDDNHETELNKSYNIINIKKAIQNIIYDTFEKCGINNNMTVVQEGISYGSSIRTKSVFDLAGLNFVLRDGIIEMCEKYSNLNYIIATPSEIKKVATGKGNANKDMILSIFDCLYAFENIKRDDIADAYFMSEYGRLLQNKNG